MDTAVCETSRGGLVGIGNPANDYKVGDLKKFVIHRHGGISPFYEDMFLNPNDRLIEIEVTKVQKVKEQEFVEA